MASQFTSWRGGSWLVLRCQPSTLCLVKSFWPQSDWQRPNKCWLLTGLENPISSQVVGWWWLSLPCPAWQQTPLSQCWWKWATWRLIRNLEKYGVSVVLSGKQWPALGLLTYSIILTTLHWHWQCTGDLETIRTIISTGKVRAMSPHCSRVVSVNFEQCVLW